MDIRKKGKIPVKIYKAKPAELYGLAKVHKKETNLRPVLSNPRKCYYNPNKFLTLLFQKIPEENIETNTNDARKTPEQIKLEKVEQILSLDKKVYTSTFP